MTDILEAAFKIGVIAVLRRRAELARQRRADQRAEAYEALADEFEAELCGFDHPALTIVPSASIHGEASTAAEAAAE